MNETWRGCVELLRRSWQEDRMRLVVPVLLVLGQAVALPTAAAALGVLTDAVMAGDVNGAVKPGVCVAALVIASLTLGHFAHIAYFELGELHALTLDRTLIDLTSKSVGIEHLERPDYADRFQVLRQELQRVGTTSMQALFPSIGLAVGIGLTATLLARQSPWLLLLPLAAVPPLLAGQQAEVIAGRAREQAAEPKRRARHLLRIGTDAGSAKELLVCGLRDELRMRHAAEWRTATAILRSAEIRAAGLRIVGQLVFAVCYVGATMLVIRDAVAGRRSVGDVVLVIVLAAQVNLQVGAAVDLLQELQRTARALVTLQWARRLVDGMARPAADAPVPERIRHGIQLQDVEFRYPGTDGNVLRTVDVSLSAGATVALVGDNGAGKSTIVKLLCRFYEPSRGNILLDGVDVATMSAARWRERITVGFQDFVRWEFSARESVGIGDLPLLDSTPAVLAALGRAGAGDLVDRFPDGLETSLGTSHPDGIQVSTGQWQKLALGRAMMREAPLLLILDEPTSALDAEAEHRLFEQYANSAAHLAAINGAITILVSHRFSTVRSADLILVVDDGSIVEMGSHDQLMAASGLYAELYELQATAYR